MSRNHLMGIDKPRPLPKAKQNRIHERHRLESVAEMLALLGILTMKQVLTGNDAVGVRGAVFQWGEGDKSAKLAAAHCIPGQIKFNGVALHERMVWTEVYLQEKGIKPLHMDAKLRNVSARTDVVDQVVNQTDSLLEIISYAGSRGLKYELAAAANHVTTLATVQRVRAKGQQSAIVQELPPLIHSAMSQYRNRAALTCEERLDWLQEKVKGAENADESATRKQQLVIVEDYLSVVQNKSTPIWFSTPSGVVELVADVVKS